MVTGTDFVIYFLPAVTRIPASSAWPSVIGLLGPDRVIGAPAFARPLGQVSAMALPLRSGPSGHVRSVPAAIAMAAATSPAAIQNARW